MRIGWETVSAFWISAVLRSRSSRPSWGRILSLIHIYCNSPLCAPSRFTLVSGRLPTRIGAWDNAADFAADTPTYAHYLRNLGYRTALSGKMHFCGPDQLHGYEERLTLSLIHIW